MIRTSAEAHRPLIRPARREDAAELAELSTQMGYPITPPLALSLLAPLGVHGDHALLVADSPSRLAGWIQISISRIFESPGPRRDRRSRRGRGPPRRGRGPAASPRRRGLGKGARMPGYGKVKIQQVFEKPIRDSR